MKMNRLACVVALVAAALCGGILSACSDAANPLQAPSGEAARNSAPPGLYRLVVLQPVAGPDGTTSLATRVVFLRPVMKGDPLPEFGR